MQGKKDLFCCVSNGIENIHSKSVLAFQLAPGDMFRAQGHLLTPSELWDTALQSRQGLIHWRNPYVAYNRISLDIVESDMPFKLWTAVSRSSNGVRVSLGVCFFLKRSKICSIPVMKSRLADPLPWDLQVVTKTPVGFEEVVRTAFLPQTLSEQLNRLQNTAIWATNRRQHHLTFNHFTFSTLLNTFVITVLLVVVLSVLFWWQPQNSAARSSRDRARPYWRSSVRLAKQSGCARHTILFLFLFLFVCVNDWYKVSVTQNTNWRCRLGFFVNWSSCCSCATVDEKRSPHAQKSCFEETQKWLWMNG